MLQLNKENLFFIFNWITFDGLLFDIKKTIFWESYMKFKVGSINFYSKKYLNIFLQSLLDTENVFKASKNSTASLISIQRIIGKIISKSVYYLEQKLFLIFSYSMQKVEILLLITLAVYNPSYSYKCEYM